MPEHASYFCPRRRAGRRRAGAIITTLVVLAVIALSGVTAWHLHLRHVEADAQRFEALTSRLHDEIQRRVRVYRHGLNGTRSAFVANPNLDRHGFRAVYETRDLAQEFPAARNMGYIQHFPATERAAFLAGQQANGTPVTALGTLSTPAESEDHDDLLVIRYVEPVQRNRGVLNKDISQCPLRRAAAEHAMRTGDIAISEPVTPALDRSRGQGMLILMPLYRPGLALTTPAQRETAIKGWVFMALRAQDLFMGADAPISGELAFQVFDGPDLIADKLLYDSHATAAASKPKTEAETETDRSLGANGPRHRSIINVSIGGHMWQVAVRSTPKFRAGSYQDVWATAGGGLLLAMLLGLLLQSQMTSLHRAQGLAQEMTADLRRVALTDRLTDLPNRAAVIPMIQETLDRSRGSTHPHDYAVLFVDMDRFKAVNDTLGHGAGDELLLQVARRLSRSIESARTANRLGAESTAARLGGDEFVVLLDGLTEPGAAATLADELVAALANPYHISGRELRVGASMGLVHRVEAYFSAEEIIRDADTAMYEAKHRGTGQCVAFDVAMRTRITDRLRIENDLSGAIDRGEFYLEYQPIVSLDTGVVESCEALVRWRHPDLGQLSPDAFIGVAEETGLIVPLGAWVLDAALAQLTRWRSAPAAPGAALVPGVSVNLSRKQLLMPDLPAQVLQALTKHGIEASALHLEVTESQVMENREVATASLRRLREAGVQIAIDDFGTGHSSLACLHAFPSDVLKVDRAFVANLDRDPNLVTLLRSVTEMARTLGKRVVAEGIETDAQHHLLHELACELGQGYRFSRPLAPEYLLAFCAQRAEGQAA